MRLIDFLLLIKDLNQNSKLVFLKADKAYPISKIEITSEACVLIPGKEAMQKQKFYFLTKKVKNRQLLVKIQLDHKQELIFGIQIGKPNKVLIK